MNDRVLWHFTCTHGYRGIGARGVLQPRRHPLMPRLGAVVWLTDQSMPDRDAVGLTSEVYLTCDRMQYRYRALDTSRARPWHELRDRAPDAVVADLERYGDPGSWWLARAPVPVALR